MLDKILDKFDWLKKVKLVELNEIDTSEDPVRPDKPSTFNSTSLSEMSTFPPTRVTLDKASIFASKSLF